MAGGSIRALLAALALCTACNLRPTTSLQGASGRTYDVISLGEDFSVGPQNARGAVAVRAFVLDYYTVAKDQEGRRGEANDIFEVVAKLAEERGDSLLVIRQTKRSRVRWLGLVEGYVVRYRRTANGSWTRIQAEPGGT